MFQTSASIVGVSLCSIQYGGWLVSLQTDILIGLYLRSLKAKCSIFCSAWCIKNTELNSRYATHLPL